MRLRRWLLRVGTSHRPAGTLKLFVDVIEQDVADKTLTEMVVSDTEEDHLRRVRRICDSLPGSVEKLSHGAPTFFMPKGVFAIFAHNHHGDGRVSVWLPASPGVQIELIQSAPDIFFRPPYVGPSGWFGILLDKISDAELAYYIRGAWKWIDAKSKKPRSKPKE